MTLALSASVAAQMRLPQDSLSFPIPRSLVSANLGSIVVDYAGLMWFTTISDNVAIGAIGTAIYRPVGGYLPRGYSIGPALRYYPGAKALWRFHYTASVAWQTAWLTSRTEVRSDGLALAVAIGWQWFASPDLAVGFELGQQYVSQFAHTEHEGLQQVFGIRPVLALSLGYAW